MHTLWQDLRYGSRMLRKTPLVSAVAVLTLALGIGATTAIFLFVNAGLIHALPIRDADRVLHIAMTREHEAGEFEAAYPTFLDWQAQDKSFSAMAGYSESGDLLRMAGGAAEPVHSAVVSANFFSTLGVSVALGRDFSAGGPDSSEALPMILSYSSWQKRFAGKADAIGQAVTLGRNRYVVIGVLPRWFEFAPVGDAEMYLPPPTSGGMFTRRNLHWIQVIGRLKPGVTLEQAASEMTAISRHQAQLYPSSDAGTGVHLVPLREIVVGEIRPVLLLVFAAAGFVLLIACANVANVLLAKSAARRQEIAVRFALGAQRQRILRQVLTESVLLALVAGAASLLITRLSTAALLATVPPAVRQTMPFLNDLGGRGAALSFTLLVSLLAGVLFGLAPALRSPSYSLHSVLGEAGRGAVGGRARLRSALVVAEIAVAAALLMVSGLLLQSVWRVVNTDPGFNRHNLLLLTYVLPGDRYKDPAAINAIQEEFERKIAALPGVEGVAETSGMPLSDCNGCNTNRFAVEGKPQIVGAGQPEAAARDISPDYFRVLQAHLRRGRAFRPQDYVANAAPVVIVNRTLEQQFFDGDALGKHLTFTYKPGLPAREVVGVVDDVSEGFLDAERKPALYTPERDAFFVGMVVRTATAPASLANAVQSALSAAEPNVTVFGVTTMDERVANAAPMFLRRLPAVLVTAFGSLALLLAAIGIYGVIAYSVAQRTREFGVRMALGASAGNLLQLVLGGALRMTVAGLAAGILAAALLARLASGLMFGMRATDFLSFALVPLVVAGIAALASYVPARRAAGLDPMEALRYE